MKKVLITGASGFIGSYLKEHLTGFEISTLSLRDPNWKKQPIDADVVIHCAGIAHVSKSVSSDEYNRINSDLAFDFANESKKNGVKHFIFLSTILVYGTGHVGEITKDYNPNPQSAYAKSKLEAEKRIFSIMESSFTVTILRIPLMYGANPKGNLKLIFRMAPYLLLFPSINNRRTYLSLSELTTMINGIILDSLGGTFLIGEKEAVSTYRLIETIRLHHGKRLTSFNLLNPAIDFLKRHNTFIGKVFGDAYYSEEALTIASNHTILDWIQSK
jgi:nucleoside-diphosphate-sugar epimerase